MTTRALAERLARDFYRQDPVTVARGLLGQQLVHQAASGHVAGVIVETEAYLGVEDKAAHSYGGRRTARTQTMYADGGTAYVFLNYGLHHLLNVVVAEVDTPQAVLIRAVQPTHGLPHMFARRRTARSETDLCSGPGKLGAAFAINRTHDSLDLTRSRTLFIARLRRRTLSHRQIIVTPRIGVAYAEEWAAAPLRFCIRDNPHVSVRATTA